MPSGMPNKRNEKTGFSRCLTTIPAPAEFSTDRGLKRPMKKKFPDR
jgi:hypothetical protein